MALTHPEEPFRVQNDGRSEDACVGRCGRGRWVPVRDHEDLVIPPPYQPAPLLCTENHRAVVDLRNVQHVVRECRHRRCSGVSRYSLLVKDFVAICLAVGLDPYLDVYHRLRYGRPAMALDLTEEIRPFIADSVVILVNNLRVNPRARIDVGADAANRPHDERNAVPGVR